MTIDCDLNGETNVHLFDDNCVWIDELSALLQLIRRAVSTIIWFDNGLRCLAITSEPHAFIFDAVDSAAVENVIKYGKRKSKQLTHSLVNYQQFTFVTYVTDYHFYYSGLKLRISLRYIYFFKYKRKDV